MKKRNESNEHSIQISNVGAESEVTLIQQKNEGRLATHEQKCYVICELKSQGISAEQELGAAVVESNPPPVNIRKVGFAGWHQQLKKIEEALQDVAETYYLSVFRGGCAPWPDPMNVECSPGDRYQAVPKFYNNRTGGQVSVCNTKACAETVGLFNSFQFTIEAANDQDAIDKLNRLLVIAPFAVALGANASKIGSVDTGWSDIRFPIWRATHPPEKGGWPRVGLPKQFYSSIHDCTKDAGSYPLIFNESDESAELEMGMLWRTARLKRLPNGKAGVEFRPLSTQPTLFGDVTMAVFVIGRLIWSQRQNESLPSIDTVSERSAKAEKRGIRAFNSEILEREILRAKQGLVAEKLFDPFAEKALGNLKHKAIRRKK